VATRSKTKKELPPNKEQPHEAKHSERIKIVIRRRREPTTQHNAMHLTTINHVVFSSPSMSIMTPPLAVKTIVLHHHLAHVSAQNDNL
jgi:hypothetical protein